MRNDMEIWQKYASFQSTSATQKYLLKNYELTNVREAELKSYDNCYSFIYYIEHGRKYYQLAEQAPVELKPILLFYGMVQLIKACILTVDPFYPETTNVLAHGVSTRKRKKRHYVFLHDEVKVQKNGLLNHAALQLFHIEQLPFERIKMEKLFARIPELNETFKRLKNKRPLLPINVNKNTVIAIPLAVLDHLKMTEQRFKQFLETYTAQGVAAVRVNENTFNVTLHSALTEWRCLPFSFHYYSGTFFIPAGKDLYQPLHEVIVHYLLLYNLSMVCRYETEWWNDLFHTYASDDLPFIRQFLSVTRVKIPFLLFSYLEQKS